MFSSFFNNSKPIHIALICGLMTVVFVSFKLSTSSLEAHPFDWFVKQGIIYLTIICTLFVVEFIVSRNKLTAKNSFGLLFFAFAMLAIPTAMLKQDILLANLFLLFSMRRLISLRSQKEVIKKLFDATFWICIASLFYFWSVIFLLLIPISLLLFKVNNIKYWLIPITAVVAVGILYACYAIIFEIDVVAFYEAKPLYDFDFSGLANQRVAISLSLMLAYFFWASIFYFGTMKAISRNLKAPYYLIFIVAVVSVLLTLIVPNKSGAEWLFFFTPFAIIMANYVQDITEVWFKESLIIAFLLIPFLGLLL